MMRRLLFLAALLPGLAAAQPRPFNCVGAEKLEDDVFSIPFAQGGAATTEAGKTNLDAAAALLQREPGRNACVLGHAGLQEGAAQASVQLAAKRAAAVAAQLSKRGVERDRIRAEARRTVYARNAVPALRSVTVVVMPASGRPS
jgi:outer membrane protein OmpA-like peptidoglycan-associated protein